MKAKTNELMDLLNVFRNLEEDNDSITVLGDDEAMRVLQAWRKTDQRWSRPRHKPPAVSAGNHAAVWSWIRDGWTIDELAISRGAGLSVRVVHEKLEMLLAARLIYPDGQISKGARTALQLHVAQKLGIKPKRRKEPAAGKSSSEGENN